MPIGRYRDEVGEMDDLECRVAAAQYPEGGLVVGMGVGIVVATLVSPALLAVTPFLGGLGGYGAGRVVRGRRLRQLRRADSDVGGRDDDAVGAGPASDGGPVGPR